MKIFESVPSENLYFKRKTVKTGNTPPTAEMYVVNVYDDVEYQTVLGFGGAFTEAAAYNYSRLDKKRKKQFLEGYFSRKRGIGYNLGRTHINSCDFSLDIYSYVEEGDKTLESFDIERDRKYIIPFLKDAIKYSKEAIMLFASPWSAPAYMKENESVIKGGKIKEEYKSVWAKYYAKYIQAFLKEGIEISAITVQNEPYACQPWESCQYSPEDERDFIERYLAPALDEAGLNDIKIIIWDHNKERVYDRTKKVLSSPEVEKRVWGVGHHWYSGDHFDAMRLVHEKFGKVIISTENCGIIWEDVNTLAERYAKEICGDFNNFTAGLCDWNLILSQNGGPYHNRDEKSSDTDGMIYEDKSSGCYAPIIYNTETKEMIFTPIYYYIGHFSRYVEKGAVRLATTKYCEELHTVAFKNPNGERVLVIVNSADKEMPATIRNNDICTTVNIKPHSIITAIL